MTNGTYREQGTRTYSRGTLTTSIAGLAVHSVHVAKGFRTAVFAVTALLHTTSEMVVKQGAFETELANAMVETFGAETNLGVFFLDLGHAFAKVACFLLVFLFHGWSKSGRIRVSSYRCYGEKKLLANEQLGFKTRTQLHAYEKTVQLRVHQAQYHSAYRQPRTDWHEFPS